MFLINSRHDKSLITYVGKVVAGVGMTHLVHLQPLLIVIIEVESSSLGARIP